MKIYSIHGLFALIFLLSSCKKDQSVPFDANKNNTSRKVRYELFTTEDFSSDKHNIQFDIFMRSGQKTIFDSTLSWIKISDIPDSTHKIIIERLVPGNDYSTLVVGFNYQIEGVGNSWYLEPFPSGDSLKLLRYSFK